MWTFSRLCGCPACPELVLRVVVVRLLVDHRSETALGIARRRIVGNPWVLLGIFWAYLFAWIGHFKIEGNRPATFKYPLWSLFGDFKMVGQMMMGRLWRGDPVAPAG